MQSLLQAPVADGDVNSCVLTCVGANTVCSLQLCCPACCLLQQEPLVAAGRLLEFEVRRPGSSPAVLELLSAEYGQQVGRTGVECGTCCKML
jgi:hypothetical protein